jgi:hypothetical protein
MPRDDDKEWIAKIWADYGAAVGQLDGEPEEMAAAVNALFNAARLQAIAVKNPLVLETFEWCAANKNIDGMSKMHLAFVPSLSSHEKTNPGLPQGCSGSGSYMQKSAPRRFLWVRSAIWSAAAMLVALNCLM